MTQDLTKIMQPTSVNAAGYQAGDRDASEHLTNSCHQY